MKLESILTIVSEARNMYVWDNGEIIAQYDGRDSIPVELNDREVELVDCNNNDFHVYLISEQTRRSSTMMYSEFLSMTGKEESYISYKEYTESIEPIYMDCKLNTKQEFIKFFNETFEKMVYPVVEKIIDDLSLTDKWEYVYGNRSDIQKKLETADDKARHLAYQYMRLYLGI